MIGKNEKGFKKSALEKLLIGTTLLIKNENGIPWDYLGKGDGSEIGSIYIKESNTLLYQKK